MVRPALIETSVSARTDRKYKYIYIYLITTGLTGGLNSLLLAVRILRLGMSRDLREKTISL